MSRISGLFVHLKFIIKAVKFVAVLMILASDFLSPSAVKAYYVEELPEGNLITNPWFRDPGDPDSSSLYGWIDAGGTNRYWSSSQKKTNPSPDIIVSGVCGKDENYCGTTARLDPKMGKTGGIGIPGVDAYLYQVVQTDSEHRKLTFFTHYVSHEIEDAGVSFYGGDSAEGPWELVWVPLHYTQDFVEKPSRGETIEAIWNQTGFLEAVLERGYSYYKVEFHARLPEGHSTGFKIAGIYFATGLTNEPPSAINLTTPVVEAQTDEIQPDKTEISSPDPIRTREARENETEVIVIVSTPTAAPIMASTSTPAPTLIPSEAPVTEAPQVSRDNRSQPGFSTGLITAGLIVLIVFGGVFLFNRIRNQS